MLERTRRARPPICSEATGLRLWGIAELLPAKRFFGLAHLSALQVTNFERNFLESRRNQRERAHIVRVAVALNHLRGYRHNLQTEFRANALLDFRAEMRGVADGARNISHGHLRGGIPESS